MNATEECSDHFLPKNLSKGTLRGCTSRKRENIVLIEVDSDEFGDVIILDVPESFREKFTKKPKHVISIDDDDDDDDDDSGCRNKGHEPDGDASTSNRSPHNSSYCANADGETVREGTTPINLSKSKRTYSGKNIPRNRYGLSSDFDICLSDSDSSDCEYMGDLLGSLHKQAENASSTPVHDTSSTCPENKPSTSTPREPFYCRTEEVTAEHHSEPSGQQSNSSDHSFNHDANDALDDSAQKVTEASPFFEKTAAPAVFGDLFRQRRGSFFSKYNDLDNGGTSTSDYTLCHCARQSTAEVSEPPRCRQFFGSSAIHDKKDCFGVCSKELVKDCNYTQQDGDAKERNSVLYGDCSANVSSESNVEVGHDTVGPPILSNDSSIIGGEGAENGEKITDDHSNIVTDRQKLKVTDEYKRAMEEEMASRQREVQQQAEEARRLRNRKRAEKMRIMANEKRQMERVAEIRETRRKDEENLNQKDQLRAEIRKDLRRLEIMCGDMSSLLRCLGIQVGGGLYPTAAEVQAAYKRACLKFHPDRLASQNLRQQVEAEEKFKLISNMKDKLSFTLFNR